MYGMSNGRRRNEERFNSFTRVMNASMISSFARNWKRSELKDGKLGLTNGIDGRQNGTKSLRDYWKPSNALQEVGRRSTLRLSPRHQHLHARPTAPVLPRLFLSKECVHEHCLWTIRRSRNPRPRTHPNEFIWLVLG